MVKTFLLDANIADVQILDCTNDLVNRQKMADANVMTFPALLLPNETFVFPSEKIIEYLVERENSKGSNN